MSLGYDGKLFILAFDHRGSFKKKFDVGSDATPEQMEQLKDAKHLVFEGFERAADKAGVPKDQLGVLVDEEMGTAVAEDAPKAGVKLAMPVEKSGQNVFDFEFGDDFGQHIEAFDPDFSKVLVRWNPGDDPDDKKLQAQRLSRLGAWLHENDRKFLFELLVPASDSDLARVEGDQERYDLEVRPELTLRAIREIRDLGVEPDIWKIEGLDKREDCEALAKLIRDGGRDDVIAVVLGRGADDARVDHWLKTGAPVEGYRGFAIGRSIWAKPMEAFFSGEMSRDEAAEKIGESFARFIEVYTGAEGDGS
jgi:myo-inositol catabolism protein IolC